MRSATRRRLASGLAQALIEDLRYAVSDAREEWADPQSSTTFGLLPSRQDEATKASQLPHSSEIVETLRKAVIRLGFGVEGLRQLRAVIESADRVAHEISPSRVHWSPDDLQVDVITDDGGAMVYSDPYLSSHSSMVFLEDWICDVYARLDVILWLIADGDPEGRTPDFLLDRIFSLEESLASAATHPPQPSDTPPPRSYLHDDVGHSITPTNGPNCPVRAIESSVRVREDRLAA